MVYELLWTKSTHHQESLPFAPNFRVVGLTQPCQGVHQDCQVCIIGEGRLSNHHQSTPSGWVACEVVEL
jgi:hypothetical protein